MGIVGGIRITGEAFVRRWRCMGEGLVRCETGVSTDESEMFSMIRSHTSKYIINVQNQTCVKEVMFLINDCT